MKEENQPNFNVVTTTKSDKGVKRGLIIGALIVLFLAISIPAGVYLVKQQQDIKEKAEAALVCPAAEACPVAGEPTLLRSCYSVGSGGVPQDVSCSAIANVGTTATCGVSKYCCPSLGASWTTDLTLCSAPSPTPTATATATPTATASATPSSSPTSVASGTPKATGTATASASPTAVPIPVSGTDWPTWVGAGIGILVIVGSILLVL